MNVFTMPGVSDMGMVWMGAAQPNNDIPLELMQTGDSEMLLEPENPYFSPSLHSISSQTMDDVQSVHSNQMDGMSNLDIVQYVDMKQESNDSDFTEDDSSQSVYMITTSTQTIPCTTKKIKPIKHPGLVLKTPIAYHSTTDPAVIPIQKDGIAVCEKCGAIGVKHAFYTRERRFCSLACARGYSGLLPEQMPLSAASLSSQMLIEQQSTATDDAIGHQQQPHEQMVVPFENPYAKHSFLIKEETELLQPNTVLDQDLPQLATTTATMAVCMGEEEEEEQFVKAPPPRKNSFNWDSQLGDARFVAAPVSCFKHAPMVDTWDNIMVGMKVEVENIDCEMMSDQCPDSFWVATVLRIIGYKALLRYEGFGSNGLKDFWISLCSKQVHPVGWCATRGKPLIPPRSIESKYSDWKEFLSKRLTGARTLPSNFTAKTTDSMRSRFDCGLRLEVVDKMRISQVKVAVIHKIVGKRLNVKYCDLPADDGGFWCHEDSPLLHPIGWASKVGHNLVAQMDYVDRISRGKAHVDDATEDLFTPFQVGSVDYPSADGFKVGMKLEAIDPLNLSSICVATVINVLRYGYIMIRIDTYESDLTGADWFCYHVKSPCIFPVGFCRQHGIQLTPPKGYDGHTFTWGQYLSETRNVAAPSHLFNAYMPRHGFVAGQKIEAADLMDPRLVCIATVGRVAGRLLKVHFDGWEEEYDQWLDCESPDIYPVGWCHSVGHKLEGPPQPVKPPNTSASAKTASQQRAASSGTGKCSTAKRRAGRKRRTANTNDSRVSLAPKQAGTPTTKSDSGDSTTKTTNNNSSTSRKLNRPVTTVLEQSTIANSSLASHSNSTRSSVQHTRNHTNNNKIGSSGQPRNISSSESSTTVNATVIPRLVDTSLSASDAASVCPEEWTVFDVAQFLRVNDCANYCDGFCKQKIDGKTLVTLKKEDILQYTGGKVGPSLKIFDLIQQLLLKVNPSHLRQSKANIKKCL